MRDRTGPSLLALLTWLRRRELVLALGLGVGALLATARCDREPLRVVTYNIEDFPKSELQIEHAFRTIAGLDAPIVAVQEILDRKAFERAAKAELGANWEAVVSVDSRAVGLLYDGDRVGLEASREHALVSGRKVLEARLAPRRGPTLRVFVVHLKAGGPEDVPIRAAQLEALTRIVKRAVEGSRDEVVVLGDFNATQEDDRRNLRRFAERTGLTWASEPLECTAYWSRRGQGNVLGDCPGSALDHVFTRSAPESIAAKGLCEDVGCDGGLLCPVGRFLVSDHCPVVTEL